MEVRLQRQSDGNEEEEDKDEDKECAVGVNEQGINGGETAKKEGGGGERESMGAGGMWTKKFCMGVRRGNFYLSLVKNTLT